MTTETMIVEVDTSLQNEIKNASNEIVAAAQTMMIQNNEDYENAGKFLLRLKTQMKRVKDYWAKPKADASAAHKTICEREKQMLTPFNDAEKIVKTNMAKYQAAVEQARREAEEEAEKKKREESERLLAEAVKEEEKGNAESAAIKVAMAEIVNDMKATTTVEKPKATGTFVRKTWKARVTEPEKVPAYVNGIEIRQISMTALNSLAKMTNGELKVDGVEFYIEQTIGTRL